VEKIDNYRNGDSERFFWPPSFGTGKSEGRMWSGVKKSRPTTTEKTGHLFFLSDYTC